MEELKTLRELAKEAGQISAATQAEVKRGELRRFYVKQVETGDAGDFSRASDEELDQFIVEQLDALELSDLPTAGTKH